MQYRDILVYLDDGVSNIERVNTAISIAKYNNARLTGVVLNAEPSLNTMMLIGVKAGDKLARETREQSESILESFLGIATEADLNCRTRLIECKGNRAGHRLSQLARNYDLNIMRQANPDNPNAEFVKEVTEAVLFASGRPVFFMPYIGAHRIPCKRAVIAWDGSAASTRAVHDSLPLMEQMEEVIILVVDAQDHPRANGELLGDNVSDHLKCHNINNRIHRVPSGGVSTSTVILNTLSDEGADILIMGGYGTSRLREIMLGGVTRTLLKSMTVPVIMSH